MFNDKNLKSNLDIIIKKLDGQNYEQDKEPIRYLSNELKKLEKKLPTIKEIEEIYKILTDLEIKYDEYNDLSYYFNPVYTKIKKVIHSNHVKDIREENKRKRDMLRQH